MFDRKVVTFDYALNIKNLAESIPERMTRQFQQFTSKSQCYVIFGLPEKKKSVYYNTVVLVGPEGIEGIYRKTHLWGDRTNCRRGIINDILIFKPGDQINVFKFGGLN